MRCKLLAKLLPVLVFSSSMLGAADLSKVRSLVDEGRTRDALSDLDAHLADHPVDPEALFLRGFVLAEIRREQEAGEVFEEVAGLRPDRPEPLNNLGVIQAAMGDYDQAVETLKEALRTHPAYRTAYENLTKIYGQLASEAYSRALSVDGSHDRASLELVLLSDMVLPPAAPVLLADVSGGKRASSPAAVGSADSASLPPLAPMAPLPSKSAVDMDSADDELKTPDQAIEAVVQQGRDTDAGPPPQAPQPAAASPGGAPAELAALVEAWAQAWSGQRVDDYLSFYSSSFQPSGEIALEEWRQQRRARLAAPEYVKVSVAFLDFETIETDRARVRFNQSYESDSFSDVVTKTLELVRRDGVWKIVREAVDS